jgi:hypothetical protein
VLDTKSPKYLEMAQRHISLSAVPVDGGRGGGTRLEKAMSTHYLISDGYLGVVWFTYWFGNVMDNT